MTVIIVKSTSTRGHFRAGMKFDREPRIVDVNEEQLALIQADARLVIVEDEATSPSHLAVSSLPPPVADSSSAGGDSSKRPKR